MNLFVRCALVGLWIGLSTTVALGEAPLELPATDVVDTTATTCRCQGDLGPSVQRIRRVLTEPLKATGLDFTEEPLENIVNFLQDEYEIPIQLDQPALEDAGLTRDEKVTVRIQHMSLQSALRLLLYTKQLTYMIRNEVLVITTPEEAATKLLVCVYDVRDLIGRERGGNNIGTLIGVIESCVAIETWAKRGGGEAEIRPMQPGLLVISQTQGVHDEIRDLLALIRETLQRPPIEAARGEPGMGRGGRRMDLGGDYGMGMSGRGREGSYGGEMGRGREPEPTPATDDPFGP